MLSAIYLTLGLLAAPAVVELHLMPPGEALTLPTGERVQCFKFEEYKILLHMDNDLWAVKRQLAVYENLEAEYAALAMQKNVVIAALQSDKDVLANQLKRAEDNWHAAEQRAIDNAGGPIWPYVLAGGGAALGVGAILFLASALSR
jgi:hypothetical protein